MKLRNKKTGEIKAFDEVMREAYKWNNYNSLAELNAEWEDAPEEPKGYWFINASGGVDFIALEDDTPEGIDGSKQIGNYFETKEEAEKAVEKLKAWKRLKDKGISFEGEVIGRKWYLAPKTEPQQRTFDEAHDVYKDIMFIFGGEE